MRNRTTIQAALAATAVAFSSALVAAGATAPARAADPPPPVTLRLPSVSYGETYGRFTYLDLRPTLTAGTQPIVITAKRAGYAQPIVATWTSSAGSGTLFDGSIGRDWNLSAFYKLVVTDSGGQTVLSKYLAGCLSGEPARRVPSAPARSPYPTSCPYNPFTLGSVQGIQSGWSSSPYLGADSRIPVGDYQVQLSITPRFARALRIPAAAATSTSTLHVVEGEESDPAKRRSRAETDVQPEPAPRPTGERAATAATPKPDLRSLPAWGMSISENGNYLEFGATVWNGGTSPLVVDGFRRDGEDVMDAYQYFFDQELNQVGYQEVGTMEWDPRPSHEHWHFSDFAKYSLLNQDKTLARRSQKEAFCLANTDAVDYTLPFADWRPEGTDLSTACGDYQSVAVREELSVGSGDSYSQIRAGQSFNLRGLPNGVYFIEVRANPDLTLVETSTRNNVSYRRITVGGVDGARTVKYTPVGLVDDSWFGRYE